MPIETAGELRGFLAECLIDIREGRMKAQDAQALSKVAAQINQSLAVEINTALQLEKMGRQAATVGTMLVGVPSSPLPSAVIEKPKPEIKPLDETDFKILDAHFQGKKWCEQCEAQIDLKEAAGCKSKFCTLRPQLEEADAKAP